MIVAPISAAGALSPPSGAGPNGATTYDELIGPDGEPRQAATRISKFLSSLGSAELARRQLAAQCDIRSLGVTFSVYEENQNVDRAWPFDIIPRVILASEWRRVERGLEQRLVALNLFIDDIYNDRRVVKAGVFPESLVHGSRHFREECVGLHPKHGAWAHICGSDLVRDSDGQLYVLEDNLRIPSGVSYMLENRTVTKRVFPELFEVQRIEAIDGYVHRLLEILLSLAPEGNPEPTVVVLTPGVFNSAYFEHCFLAQQMGVELVEGQDLFVDSDDRVYMKTIEGLKPVHVIYRRVDDESLDPEVFAPDSLLGCRGLMRAWRAGRVALVNAPGAGVADDKLVYSYVPDLIRYYLGEDAILPNVYTYRLTEPKARAKVLGDLTRFVIKPTGEAGGYGVVVGSAASHAELERCRRRILENPRDYVAQPIVNLSTAPTLCGASLEPRHLDLRPFILSGRDQYVTRGGLTRVALRSGSLVVNSSQGGGSKDTWVVHP